MSNITAGNPDQIQVVVGAGLLPPLIEVLVRVSLIMENYLNYCTPARGIREIIPPSGCIIMLSLIKYITDINCQFSLLLSPGRLQGAEGGVVGRHEPDVRRIGGADHLTVPSKRR